MIVMAAANSSCEGSEAIRPSAVGVVILQRFQCKCRLVVKAQCGIGGCCRCCM